MADSSFFYNQHFENDETYHDDFINHTSEVLPQHGDQSNMMNQEFVPSNHSDFNYFFVDDGVPSGSHDDSYINMVPPTEDYLYFPDEQYSDVQTDVLNFCDSVSMAQQDVPTEYVPLYPPINSTNTNIIVNETISFKKEIKHVPQPVPVEPIDAPPILEFHGYSPAEKVISSETEELAVVQKKELQKYVDSFRFNVDNNSFRSRAKYYDILSGDDLYARLEKLDYCDPADRRCTYYTCGRRFINLEILAFHVGYAHQAVNNSATCTVCGMTCRNAKGKLAHMLTAHKSLAKKHQHVCMIQAPKLTSLMFSNVPDVVDLTQ